MVLASVSSASVAEVLRSNPGAKVADLVPRLFPADEVPFNASALVKAALDRMDKTCCITKQRDVRTGLYMYGLSLYGMKRFFGDA